MQGTKILGIRHGVSTAALSFGAGDTWNNCREISPRARGGTEAKLGCRRSNAVYENRPGFQ